jgi:hypothetical protein
MKIEEAKVLDETFGDDWRSAYNGEELKHCSVNCERCGADELDVKSTFRFTYAEAAVLLLCSNCLTEMRNLLNTALE